MKRVLRVKTRRGERLITAAKLKDEDEQLYTHVSNLKPGNSIKLIKLKRGRVAPLPDKSKRKPVMIVRCVHPSEMSEAMRKKVCPRGLRGEARRMFIEEGIPMAEQRERAKLSTALHMQEVMEEYRRTHPVEFQRTLQRRELRKQARREKKEKETGKKQIDYSKYVSPADMAEEAELSPLEIRKFLRLKGIGKRGGRYAFKRKEADRIIRAAIKHYEEAEA